MWFLNEYCYMYVYNFPYLFITCKSRSLCDGCFNLKHQNIEIKNKKIIRGSLYKFPDFFEWALLLIVHTWNSSPLRTNLLRLQCTCIIPTTSGRPHASPLVWACQWPSSQPHSSPQLSHNDSLWAKGITKSHREQGLDYREAEELSWCPSWSNSLWQGCCMDWCIVWTGALSWWKCHWVDLKSAGLFRRNLFLNSLKTSI